MKLIEYDGVELRVADEAFLIKSIRELFYADKSKKHEDFWRQISYLWFLADPRSTYQYIADENERAKEIKAQEGFPEEWEPSELLKKAVNEYRTHTVTTASLLIQSMRKGIDTLRSFFETADLTSVDDKGKPIYPIASYVSALKQVPELSKALSDAEKALVKDFDETNNIRGNKELSPFEDD